MSRPFWWPADAEEWPGPDYDPDETGEDLDPFGRPIVTIETTGDLL